MSIFSPVEPGATITLRPSEIVAAMSCMRKLGYIRAGIRPESSSYNLVFGTAIHLCVERYLNGEVTEPEMAPFFRKVWSEALKQQLVEFPMTKKPELFADYGAALAERFPMFWSKLGLEVIYTELQIALEIPAHNVIIKMTIDLVARATRELYNDRGVLIARPGDIGPVDWKSTLDKEPYAFGIHSSQLSYYWMGLGANRERLGLGEVSFCAYSTGTKPAGITPSEANLKKAQWQPPRFHSRDRADLEGALEAAVMVADNIRRGGYPKSVRMAHDSPCDGQVPCSYKGLCTELDPSGLVLPETVRLLDAA